LITKQPLITAESTAESSPIYDLIYINIVLISDEITYYGLI